MMSYIFFDENKQQIDKLIQCFNIAESRLKEIERSNVSGIVIPAINELRYSAQHIILSLNDTSVKDQEESILRAIRHAQRASYDAIEAGILYALDEIRSMQDGYQDMAISSVIQGWTEIMGKAEINKKKIIEIKY